MQDRIALDDTYNGALGLEISASSATGNLYIVGLRMAGDKEIFMDAETADTHEIAAFFRMVEAAKASWEKYLASQA